MTVGFWRKIFITMRIAVVSCVDAVRVIGVKFLRRNNVAYIHEIIHDWARLVLSILQVDYKIIDHHGFIFLEHRSYIIMSNHCSHVDIPLIYATFAKDKLGMISKKEIFRIPIFGYSMKLGGCLSIDRKNKRQAARDLLVAKDRMLAGMRLWIAPEGTRSSSDVLGTFKKGGFKIAREVNAMIVPVTIVGSHRVLPAKTLDYSLGELVEIHIGRPIDTMNYSANDLEMLMADTAKAISSRLPKP